MVMPHKLVTAILGSAGVAHFVAPKLFDSIVPPWMPGNPRITTYVSGAAELLSAALVAHPRTRRLGGVVALATFVGVYPANIWAALDGGMKDAPPPMNSAAAAWIRLPFQFPLMWLAWQTMRQAQRDS
jgi:uncharacterized membrane protein